MVLNESPVSVGQINVIDLSDFHFCCSIGLWVYRRRFGSNSDLDQSYFRLGVTRPEHAFEVLGFCRNAKICTLSFAIEPLPETQDRSGVPTSDGWFREAESRAV